MVSLHIFHNNHFMLLLIHKQQQLRVKNPYLNNLQMKGYTSISALCTVSAVKYAKLNDMVETSRECVPISRVSIERNSSFTSFSVSLEIQAHWFSFTLYAQKSDKSCVPSQPPNRYTVSAEPRGEYKNQKEKAAVSGRFTPL